MTGNIKKKLCYLAALFSLVISMAAISSRISVSAVPEQSSDPAPKLTGYCGDTTDKGSDPEGHNAYYELLDENLDGAYDTLRIYGTGRMGHLQKENEYTERYHFYEHPKNIETVYIDGVTNVANMSSSFAEKFVLSDTVTMIDSGTFSNAYIEEITAPNVREIGDYAFERSKIKEINLNAAVKIGWRAFKDCKDLTKVTIGKKVEELGDDCFAGCTGLVSITVPSNVKSIGLGAFEDCVNLTEISLAEGIETILGEAFYGCSSLKSLKLPESLKMLGHAFSNNDGLTELYIPGGADIDTKLGSYLVKDCINLKKLTLGEGITIANKIASGCPKLDEIYYPSTLIRTNIAKSIDNCPLIKTVGPDKGYNINYAWKEEIPEWAFFELDSLETVTIGGTVKTVGRRACYNCVNITTVNLKESVETIGDEAFALCVSLARINFSKKGNLTTIGKHAFKDCEGIVSLDFPKSVKNILGGAFSGCSELKDVRIYRGDIEMGEGPFGVCPELKTAGPDGDGSAYNVTFVNLTRIPGAVLAGNEFLERVVIPGTVTEIGAGAFRSCTSLSEVVMSESVKVIGRGAFERCLELKEFTIPSLIEKVGDNAFANCTGLRSLTFPLSLTEFGSSVVPKDCVIYGYDNSPSDERSYGSPYVSLGKACAVYFVDTHTGERIKRYVLLDSEVGEAPEIKVTMKGAKFQCWAYDDKHAFSPDYNVGRINTVSFYAKYYINGVPEFDPKAKVKEELIAGYREKAGDCTYELSEISSDGVMNVVLTNCTTDAAKIVVGEKVKIEGLTCRITAIGQCAFSNSKNAKSITIGKNVGKLNANAFSGCDSLKKIVIKTKKLKIDDVPYGAFYYLDKDVVITVPKSKYKLYKEIFEKGGFEGKVKKG